MLKIIVNIIGMIEIILKINIIMLFFKNFYFNKYFCNKLFVDFFFEWVGLFICNLNNIKMLIRNIIIVIVIIRVNLFILYNIFDNLFVINIFVCKLIFNREFVFVYWFGFNICLIKFLDVVIYVV